MLLLVGEVDAVDASLCKIFLMVVEMQRIALVARLKAVEFSSSWLCCCSFSPPPVVVSAMNQ